jgi:hypothetical protein
MRLPEPTRAIRLREEVIDAFQGYNNTETASDREFKHTHNLSSSKYPHVVPRDSREVVQTLTTPNGIYSFKDILYTVDGTSFKKNGVTKGTVTNGKKQLIEFNLNILIFPDMKFYDTVADTFGSFGTGDPAIKKAAVHNNRVFGVNGSNLYASKQGDFKNWNTFDQLNTDSWATDVAGAVEFNTIGAYQNHVVIQSNLNMFELYGYMPSNFQLQETVKVGSTVFDYIEVDSALYFANREGLFVFTGGVPRRISTMIDMPFVSCELGTDGKAIYASVFNGQGYHLFKFDVYTKIVYREDNLNVVQFTRHSDKLHALLADGRVLRFGTGTEIIDWELETIEFTPDLFGRSGIKRVELHVELAAGSIINVFLKTDSSDFILHKTFTTQTDRILRIPMILSSVYYKIKVTGRGYAKLTAIKHSTQRGGKF